MLCCCVQYAKFIPNKEHQQTALIFCFHLKNTFAELYRLFREAYGEHVPSQDTCERWFWRFKSGDFDTRQEGRHEHEKPPKKFEDVELQALLGEDESQTKNNWLSNWALVNKQFPIRYERWERFRRPVDE